MDKRGKAQALTTQWAAKVWQSHLQGLLLEGEAVEVAYCMEHHREWWPVWESLATCQDSGITIEGPDGEVNPLLHVHLDATVKRQIDGENPREVKVIYNLLRAKGFDEFAAIHVIDLALTDEIWRVAKEKKDFNESRYIVKTRHYATQAILRRK